ncbi:hypothetical protein BX600DRAFT_548873 [Xylariales sp. PMI_506]|nr:hypothetical protein BX600DRAFT_548873 [Xylariales sp. PMI_506]
MAEPKPVEPQQAPSSNGSIQEKIPLPYTNEEFMSDKFTGEHMAKVVREGILLSGGAAAILLQVAMPGVAAGVNEHSNFAYRVMDRLRTTMTFVYCMTFGTAQEKKTICDMITAVHVPVVGTLNEGSQKGKQYSALDPDLQLWVAATLYGTAIPVYESIFGRIEDELLAEKIYQEYGILACSLQVPAERWPRTRKDFWVYWDETVAGLEVTQHARDVARDLLALKQAPWYLRLGLPFVRVLTAELLPPKLRDDYGLTKHNKSYSIMQFGVKATYPALPKFVRTYPVKLYMKDMRKRMATRRRIIGKGA